MSDSRQPIILVAEDTEADADLLRRAFRDVGVNALLHFAENGEEAIAYLEGEGKYGQRTEFPLPDLLLLDLKMPRANGFEVIEWVRSQPRLSPLRIVVLTTSDQFRDIDRAHRVGANSFLVKPITYDDFVEVVRKLCDYWLEVSKLPYSSRPARRSGPQ